MLLFQTENGRRKPRLFSLIRLSFAHHADGSLSFSRLFTKKYSTVSGSYPFANRINELNRLSHL